MATGSSDGDATAPYFPPPRYRLWFMLPLAVAAGLLALDRTNLDLALTARLYDPVSHGFPLRTTFLFDTVLHHWTKYLVASIACLAWCGYLVSFAVPLRHPPRRVLLYLGLAFVLAPASVAGFKLLSYRHCPWDVVEFGGFAPYLALLDATPAGLAAGHCFPAGHATTGFSLMAFYFAGIAAGQENLARAGLAVGLAAGLGLGFARMVQGAHFLSHVLWSGLACWLVLAALHVALFRPGARGLK